MSVSDSFTPGRNRTETLPKVFDIDESAKSILVRLGREASLEEAFIVRCRKEITRLLESGDFETVLFDLEDLLILPSSALGLIAAVSRQPALVIVKNASPAIHEDFQLTGLYRMVEFDPAPGKSPPAK